MGKNPTDRGKSGSKKSVLTDAQGGPLGAVVAAANVNDHLLLEATIEALVVERPQPSAERPQHLCLDGGYNNEPSREVAARHRYTAHIRPRGEEAQAIKREVGYKARRWVVERTHSWMNRFRRLLIRWEKKPENYLAMLHLACALITFRAAGLPG